MDLMNKSGIMHRGSENISAEAAPCKCLSNNTGTPIDKPESKVPLIPNLQKSKFIL